MKYILSLFLLFSLSLSFAQTRYYVNGSAAGQDNGQNWTDAFVKLQSALQLAQAGDEVWVAEGTYYTSNGLNRSLSFEPKSGVKVFGGFAGSESSVSQRDLAAHTSVLSADIGVVGDSTDNSYNVMYLHRPDSNTVIDGFTMRDGNADVKYSNTYGRAASGGGLYIHGDNSHAYPEIRNCIFIHNTGIHGGGGAMVLGSTNTSGTASVAPRFIDCRFEYNSGYIGGGLLRLGGSMVERGDDLKNCVFINNKADFEGGGFYYFDSERKDHLTIRGCRFEGNTAKNAGGGIHMTIGRTLPSGFSIIGTSFERNESGNGGAIFIKSRNSFTVKDILIDSCSFKDNVYLGLNTTLPKAAIYIKLLGKEAKGSFKNSVIEGHTYWQNALYMDCSNTEFVCDHLLVRRNDTPKATLLLKLGPEFFISNSVFAENYIQQSIISNDFDSHYDHCLFYQNTSDSPVNYFAPNNQILTLVNCIFSGNNITIQTPPSPAPNVFKKAYNCIFENISNKSYFLYTNKKTEYTYCFFDALDCQQPNATFTCGPGNIIGGNPMFRDRGKGDFSLLPCSPLINAGSNIAVTSIFHDFNGNERIQGGTVDIGAFEAPAFALLNPPDVLPACENSNGGAISITPVNGCEPYIYKWNPPAGNGEVINELPPGAYSFTVTDALGKTIQRTVHIPTASSPQLSPLVQDIQCGSQNGGSAAVAVTSGRSPYTFLWNNGAADSLLSALPAGRYDVTVIDKNGCSDSLQMMVSLQGQLAISTENAAISCFGASDASLSASADNGKAPFAYLWSPGGATDSLLTDLGPGVYNITTTDFYGCTASASFTLNDPALLQAFASATITSSLQNPNGSASALGSGGGTFPYAYQWSNGEQTPVITNLSAGIYTVTVTDAHGCSAIAEATVNFVSSSGEAADQQVQVWPNPMQERLDIKALNLSSGEYRFILRDVLGREVAGENLVNGSASLPVSSLPAGIYTWELLQGRLVRSGKVVK